MRLADKTFPFTCRLAALIAWLLLIMRGFDSFSLTVADGAADSGWEEVAIQEIANIMIISKRIISSFVGDLAAAKSIIGHLPD